jgi:hypothetical protein
VQVDPIKPKLKPPIIMKLNCHVLLSTSAFKFNLRRYTTGEESEGARDGDAVAPQPAWGGMTPGDARAATLRYRRDVVAAMPAGAYTRPLFSSTEADLVTPPRVPLSNTLGGFHAPNVSIKMC